MNAPLPLVEATVMMAAGAALLAFPRWMRSRAEDDHARRVADRLQRGRDAYFEELRSLQAYRPARSLIAWQLMGVAFAVAGAFLFALQITR